MNTKNFKTFPGYFVEYSYDHHAYVSKEEFDRYYGAMNLYAEASDKQVMTAILNLPANPSEEDDLITDISPVSNLFRIWTCIPDKTSISRVASFITAAKLGILSKREAEYVDASFLDLLLRNSHYVAVESKDGDQIILTVADFI